MELPKDFQLEQEITDEILSVAELYGELTTSDLQGSANATAKDIIKFVRRNRP